MDEQPEELTNPMIRGSIDVEAVGRFLAEDLVQRVRRFTGGEGSRLLLALRDRLIAEGGVFKCFAVGDVIPTFEPRTLEMRRLESLSEPGIEAKISRGPKQPGLGITDPKRR